MEKQSFWVQAAVAMLAVCVLVVFWPSSDSGSRYTAETTYHVTQDQMIPAETAIAEAERIEEEARRLSENNELTVDRLFVLQKRMKRLSVYAEQYGPNPRVGFFFYNQMYMFRLVSVRDSDPGYRSISKEEHSRYRKFFETDPEWLELDSFRASTTTDNKQAVVWHYIRRYMMSIPFGIIACILLMRRDGVRLGYALVKVFNHPFLMVLYPFGILWSLAAPYVSGPQHRKEVKRLVSGVSYATAACISVFFGGAASAQTSKKDEKKKSDGFSLQLDNRVIAPVEGPPPAMFNRTTLNAKRWLVEAISTAVPETGAWSNETGVGVKIVRTSRTTVNALGIVSNDSNGTRKLIFGGQYFRAGPTSVLAIPVARVEKTIDGKTALAAVANPLFRLSGEGIGSRWALSPDVTVRKTFGKPVFWVAGMGLDFFTRKGKADRAEVAVLKNSSRQWQVRGRYVLNFAF